jgi:hypothetical protein
MASPAADLIVLDALGMLYAHGHGIGGYCLVCQRILDVSLPALNMERSGGARVVGMKPLTCLLPGAAHLPNHGATEGRRLGVPVVPVRGD